MSFTINYAPPGPVAAAFMQSVAPVHGIMGPIGSGKTSAVLMKMVRLAQRQKPSTRDGVRRFRFCVVRDTYRQLWKTTIPSWWKWVSKDLGDWVGSNDGPASHTIRFEINGEIIELIADFVAIGENKVEDVLRGYEVTVFYLNEADLLAPEVLVYCRGRAGRFPSMDEGGPTYWGVIVDFNAPDTDNYLYQIFFEAPSEDFEIFVQPSGFSPDAENLANLPPGYYENQASGQPDWYVRRMLRNEFGFSRAGKPVYEEWNDQLHVAQNPLVPVRELDLVLGLDAGLSPAAVFGQRMPIGQWRILDELVFERAGAKRFGRSLAQRLKERFPGMTIEAHADPSSFYGADSEEGEQAWVEIVAAEAGILIHAAPTNRLVPRLEAVRQPLTRLIDGSHPGFLLDPRCKVLRKGFNAGYRYRRLKMANEERYTEEPEKNDFSHPHDGLQYLLSGGGEHTEVMGRKAGFAAGLDQTHAITEEMPSGKWGGARRGRQAFAISD